MKPTECLFMSSSFWWRRKFNLIKKIIKMWHNFIKISLSHEISYHQTKLNTRVSLNVPREVSINYLVLLAVRTSGVSSTQGPNICYVQHLISRYKIIRNTYRNLQVAINFKHLSVRLFLSRINAMTFWY